jgi:hypothetical protein
MMELPAGTLRLFAHDDPCAPGPAPDLVIARLLEDGDASDLAWLFGTVGEGRVGEWFAARGGRQLSARSRAFWQQVLGRPPGPAAPVSPELWPL